MLLEKLAELDFRYSLGEDFISPISCIIFFFWPYHSGMWDLSSLTSDQTHTPCNRREVPLHFLLSKKD